MCPCAAKTDRWRAAIAYSTLLLLVGCSSIQPTTLHSDQVNVYFATTRVYRANGDLEHAFTTATAKKERVSYGTAKVMVPVPRPEGVQAGIAVGSYKFSQGDPLREFRALTSAETANAKRPLVVFLHGFNVPFASAAERAALFAHDLQPDVATNAAIFSGASQERLFGYAHDEDSVLINQDDARKFLEVLRRDDSLSPVVLIGHSMGGRLLTYALRDLELIQDRGKRPKLHPRFAQLILIEPDVNEEYFRENIQRLRAMCGHVTVYASSHDRALMLSRLIHGSPREGELEEQGLMKKIDVIDASAARRDWIGHSYDGPPLFEDIRSLLRGLTVEQRAGTTLAQDSRTKVYALLRKLPARE